MTSLRPELSSRRQQVISAMDRALNCSSGARLCSRNRGEAVVESKEAGVGAKSRIASSGASMRLVLNVCQRSDVHQVKQRVIELKANDPETEALYV